MNYLIIDASQPKLMIILVHNGLRSVYLGNDEARRHASMILSETEAIMAEEDLTPADIDVFGAVTGPGSFTGIRIGTTTVNALVAATGKKLVTMTSLESIAYGMDNVVVLMDCKHTNYYALVRREGKEEYLAINEKDLEEEKFKGLERVYYAEPEPESTLAVFIEKLGNGEFSELARPFYIKKSSAEK